MDIDDLEPQRRSAPVRDLQPLSLEELEEYIADLEREISRAEDMMAKKKAHKVGIDALFGAGSDHD